MNLLEIGKIVRVHGIKGSVKVISYVDEDFSKFKHVYLTIKKISANILSVKSLNGDAYSVLIDIIPTVEEAEKYKNQSVYIDRDEYKDFKNKIYLSDLVNKPVIDENGNKLGEMIDYEDYGASVILTIKCGVVSFSIPYVQDFVAFDKDKDAFVIEKQKFEDMRVWE